MNKSTQKSILFALIAFGLIVFAMGVRYINRMFFNCIELTLLRSGIYIFLFTAWGFSIHTRIIQTQVRRYLLTITALMVLWLMLRSVKYSINSINVSRMLWYFYYLPMLFIPMLSVFVSFSLGKSGDFRLPSWTKLFYVPTAILFLFVLTNDLHQSVFSFPSGIMTDRDYCYENGYFLIFCWELMCAGSSFIIMLLKCRIPHSKQIRLLPFILLFISIAYTAAYIYRIHWVWFLAGDFTVTQCLLFACIYESCIRCGLIQSNMGYDELLEATSLPVQITDSEFNTKYISSAMQEPLPESMLRDMTQDAVKLNENTLLKRHRLRRGWVFWNEDILKLNNIQKELELTGDELKDTGDVLSAENAQRARLLKLTEENRLYDEMERQTAKQISMLRERLDELKKTENISKGRHLLGQIIVIGTYIKRRNNLIFVGVQQGFISVQELRLCLNESAENLNLYGITCRATVKGEGKLTIEQAANIYDLFEAVVEAGIEFLDSLLVFIEADPHPEVNICISGTESLSDLKIHFPELNLDRDEDGLQYITCSFF